VVDYFMAYFNGDWLPIDQCKISLNDRGFRLGDAVYDVERTFNGKIFDLDGHLDRLFRSLKYVRIDPGLTSQEVVEISKEAVTRNWDLVAQGGEVEVRQVITRGEGGSVLDITMPTVYIAASPLNFSRFAHLYDDGCHVVFARTRAYHPNSLDPKVKYTSRMNFVLAELEASDVDPSAWPVLLDLEGNIAEGTTFNLWIVKDGILKSPKDRSIIHGISRKNILQLAKDLDISVEFEDLQLYDAYTADEVFISVTSPCLLPVSKLDNRSLERPAPGPINRRLLAAWSEKVGVDIIGQAKNQSGVF